MSYTTSTLYMYMYHYYKLITNNVNIPFMHDSDSTGSKILYFMPSVNYPVFFFSVQSFWVCKMGSFFNLHWWITETPKARATRGVGNMLPQKILKSWCSETSFLMFWEDKLCLKCSVFMPSVMFTTLHTSTPIAGVHYRTWNYRRLILRYQKGKNGWETTEKRQRIVLKKTGWTKKTLSFIG